MSFDANSRRQSDQRTIELIYFDAGGGHRAAAAALKSVLEHQHRNWQIDAINLRDLLEPVDFLRGLSGVRVENIYNDILKHDLTVSVAVLLPVLHLAIRLMHAVVVKALASHWRRTSDLVVSLIPHFNRAIFDGLRLADRIQARPQTPMVTIMTDLADYPPHFWIERQPQYIVCGTAKAQQQAWAIGHPEAHVLRTSGMVVRPEFYAHQPIARGLERARLGLRTDSPTGIVMFGGYGSSRMRTIAESLADGRTGVQFIFVCGHNQKLRDHLESMRLPFPHCVLGFTTEIPRLMSLADFFIGKPGPGSISEALIMGLPVIVERNSSTMVHERYNVEWILANEVGVALRSFTDVARTVDVVTNPAALDRFRNKVRAIENRAIFEIPEMLESAMERSHRGAGEAMVS
jgi:hypothetical protein